MDNDERDEGKKTFFVSHDTYLHTKASQEIRVAEDLQRVLAEIFGFGAPFNSLDRYEDMNGDGMPEYVISELIDGELMQVFPRPD